MKYNGYERTTEGSIKIFRNKKDKLSANFSSNEFFSAMDNATEGFVHRALVYLLQDIRHKINKPIRINSGYRSPLHNQSVGGAKNSTHIYGMGADIRTDDAVDLTTLELMARELGAGGVKRYNTFVHVDVWKTRTW